MLGFNLAIPDESQHRGSSLIEHIVAGRLGQVQMAALHPHDGLQHSASASGIFKESNTCKILPSEYIIVPESGINIKSNFSLETTRLIWKGGSVLVVIFPR